MWITANKDGLKTATLFWPGDEIWTHPLNKHIQRYDKAYVNEERIAKIFEWIDQDDDLSLVTLYFSLIDDAGHRHGPESPEMDFALRRLDAYLDRIVKELKARGLYDNVNLLIVSDHGLIQATKEGDSNIYIDQLIPDLRSKILWMDYNVVTSVFPLPGGKLAPFG